MIRTGLTLAVAGLFLPWDIPCYIIVGAGAGLFFWGVRRSAR